MPRPVTRDSHSLGINNNNSRLGGNGNILRNDSSPINENGALIFNGRPLTRGGRSGGRPTTSGLLTSNNQ